MESYAPGTDQDAPKVEAGPATEDVEDPDGEFYCHPEWNSCEDSEDRP